MQFYGYYTLDFSKDGKVSGMLSVNGYSGQVFLHTWHGSFIEESAQ
jgi:heat shock protein HslJ